MWGDMLKFGLECENVTFANEIKTKNIIPPSPVPLKYNRSYDIDKMVAITDPTTAPVLEPSQTDAETITFCQEGKLF